MTFAQAAAAGPSVLFAAVRNGKDALPADHARRISAARRNAIPCSVSLDTALGREPEHASAHRWDYGIGYLEPGGAEVAMWIEVHPARSGEVGAIIRKKKWLRDFLVTRCRRLYEITPVPGEGAGSPYVWIASGTVNLPKGSKQYRQLLSHNIRYPCVTLDLP